MKHPIDEILKQLPKTTEAELHLLDQATRNFIMMLAQGSKPMDVIDEMLIHYTSVVKQYQSQIKLGYDQRPIHITVKDEESLRKLGLPD